MSCASTSVPERKKRSILHTKIGTSLLTKGQLPQALGELLQAIDLDPNNAVAHNNIALVYLLREKYILSEEHLQKAVTLDPKYTEARNNLGRVLIERKKYKEAIQQLKTAADDLTYATPEKVYDNLGLAYYRAKQLKEALNATEHALKVQRNRCSSLNLYGRIQYDLKKYKLASTTFDQAIENCEKKLYAEPHYFAGLSYMMIGQNSLAKSRFEEVIKLFPSSEYSPKARLALRELNKGF
ncbi:MAG: tetratricopeptide repeat protein [Bdellovibrionales bacterium]|nr:tetratricopeptide repeat protein [Bdellovibrionales bacterium]